MNLIIKHYKILLLLLPIFFINTSNLIGQSITWGPTTPAGIANSLEVYNGQAAATFQFTNNGTPLTNVTLQVDMGIGVVYAGGFNPVSSAGAIITELSYEGDSPALFHINHLKAGEQITLTFDRKANCAARIHKSEGGIFSDTLRVLADDKEVTYVNNGGEPFVATYDLTYANVIIGAINHSPSSSAGIGQTITRSFRVTNGSFGGLNEFWIRDSFKVGNLSMGNFSINGAPIAPSKIINEPGGINIHFDNSIIPEINGTAGTIGDGDSLFEKDEFFLLSYEVTLLSCGIGNATPSTLTGYYGADIDTPCPSSGQNTTNVNVNNGVPVISIDITVNPYIELCGTVRKCVRLINRANAPEDFAMDLNILNGSGQNNDIISSPFQNILDASDVYNWENYTINDSIVNLVAPPSGPASISYICLLYTSPSPRDATLSRMPSSA